MPLREQGHDQVIDDAFLSDDDAPHLLTQPRARGGSLSEKRGIL